MNYYLKIAPFFALVLGQLRCCQRISSMCTILHDTFFYNFLNNCYFMQWILLLNTSIWKASDVELKGRTPETTYTKHYTVYCILDKINIFQAIQPALLQRLETALQAVM